MEELTSVEEFVTKVNETQAAYVLVTFTAPWCQPCKVMAPLLEEIANLHNHVEFTKVNVDSVPNFAASYGVRSVPTYKLFSKGSTDAVAEVRGAQNRHNFEQWLLANTPVDVETIKAIPRDVVIGISSIESSSRIMGQ